MISAENNWQKTVRQLNYKCVTQKNGRILHISALNNFKDSIASQNRVPFKKFEIKK